MDGVGWLSWLVWRGWLVLRGGLVGLVSGGGLWRLLVGWLLGLMGC